MDRFAFLILAILPASIIQAQNTADEVISSNLSFGLKIGFAATGTYVGDAQVNAVRFDDYRQDTQLGTFGMIHVGYGKNRIYLQSGIGMGANRSAFYLEYPETMFNGSSDMGFSYKMTNIMIPLQIGYNAVNQPPYRMSFYAGPKLRCIMTDSYGFEVLNPGEAEFHEYIKRNAIGLSLGMNVQIGRTFFEMEYEAGLTDISDNAYAFEADGTFHDMTLERRMGIFAFSYGILF